jgi:hypothetical protein
VDQRCIDADRRFDDVDVRFIEVDRRFAVVERHSSETASPLTALRQDRLGHFDEVYRRFERLEEEYRAMTQARRRIEGR